MRPRSLPRVLSLVLALGLAGTATLPDVAEAVTAQLKARIKAAKEDVRESRRALKDDEKDLKRIERISEKWHAAWEDRNDRKKAKIDEDLLEWLQEELAENREDRARARQELEELGGDPDSPPARSHGGKTRPGQGHGGRRHRPTEPAARADARADLEAEREDFRRTREIAAELREVQRRFNRGTAGPQVHEQKSRLLRELVRSARRDVRRSTRELAEDEARLAQLKARR